MGKCLKKFVLPSKFEVEFHENKIGDQFILPVFMRSKLQFFMRSNSKPNLPNIT
jgi:hypothetical protein